ncbi:YceI family protein [Fulvivirga ligni]|uniref:YceI family protein n=1 Tax=Fulvivirga ligni TaxID=2904246 RepID=UPI001F467CE1|nr:YceI family protein [Fulvivirga ligni]UII19196.1 YceI family protein [Fulvivirga ligni]
MFIKNALKLTPLALCLASMLCNAQGTKHVTILPESTFSLSGTSNVNHFTCNMTKGLSRNQLAVCYQEKEDLYTFDNSGFALNINKFDCENSRMTHDLQDALQSDEFPVIKFELLSIKGLVAGDCEAEAESLITIAGNTNKYLLTYQVKQVSEESYKIELKANFNMRDFNITPPTALMGIVKVNEIISINLHLHVTMK